MIAFSYSRHCFTAIQTLFSLLRLNADLGARQMRALAEMEHSGLVPLLMQDQAEDLARMHSLFSRVEGGSELLRSSMVRAAWTVASFFCVLICAHMRPGLLMGLPRTSDVAVLPGYGMTIVEDYSGMLGVILAFVAFVGALAACGDVLRQDRL